MEFLRESVQLKAYGQIDPLVAYRIQGHKMFQRLMRDFERRVVDTILKIQFVPKDTTKDESLIYKTHTLPKKKVGRNDPCPCGSGKKYKKCCWPKYGY